MIDLNDIAAPKHRHDLAVVKDRLACTAADWLPGLFPEARLARDRRSLRCADLSGRPPRKEGSCTIHLDGPYAGWGFDYATGERAGPIDMIAQATGLCDGALFDEAARIAGMDQPAPRSAPRPKPDHSAEIARLVDGAMPIAGTPGETYLRARGLSDPGSPDLLFHPDLPDFDSRRGWPVAPVVVGRAVGAVARELRIHPVRDWLDTLRWDGAPRIATWTSAYLGAEPTAFHHTIGALWMISAVARIYRPGVKADHMLILEGPQGARKSTALKVLAGEEWFTDELPELGSKDAAMHMQGVWIVEIAELDAIGRAEVSRIKAFLTRTTDRFRPPYGRYTVEVPRQCAFAGTVNPDTYLRDETGNRRFWPLRCGTIDIAALARDRDQLWAEAVQRFRDGAIWWIDDAALLAEAREAQDSRYQSDAWDARIDRWLTHETRTVNRGHAGWEDWREEEVERSAPIRDVSVGEILESALGIEPAKWTKSDQMRVGAWLKSRNWERYQWRSGERREWRYRKPSAVAAA